MSQFSECDAIQLVKIYEQSVKSSKPRKDKPEDKSVKEKPVKDKEQLRREKREREEKKKRHRAELKRQYELSQKQGTSGQSGQNSRQRNRFLLLHKIHEIFLYRQWLQITLLWFLIN